MPEVDGIEALTRIQSAAGPNQHSRIVALTAHAASEDRTRILRAGFESVITKPLTQKAVTALCRTQSEDADEEMTPDAVIALLGQEKYDAALAEFHQDLAALHLLLTHAEPVREDVKAAAHRLVGAAAVLGIGPAWDVLRRLETATGDEWSPACIDAETVLTQALEAPASPSAPAPF